MKGTVVEVPNGTQWEEGQDAARFITSRLAAIAVIAALAGGCQTRTTAAGMAGIGAGGLTLGLVAAHHNATTRETEPPEAMLALALIVLGGATLVVSGITAIAITDEKPPAPPLTMEEQRACTDERREIMRRASATTDVWQRGRVLRDLPSCEPRPVEAAP